MSPDEMRVAVAEACGWTGIYRKNACEFSGLVGVCPKRACEVIVPSFVKCLNAMHEAVMALPEEKQDEFRLHLEDVIVGRKYGAQRVGIKLMGKEQYRAWFNATAAQRAKAFLRTLGLWKEEEG